jgi:thiol-disulfide isomerase/thioredoxin
MFWDSYPSEVKAVIRFTELLNVKVNRSTIDNVLQNHPDWPSFLCISDSLHKWHIPNAAGKIEPAQIDELPVPFLAYTSNNATPLAVITNISEGEVTYYTDNYKTPVIKKREGFLIDWQGIFLMAEKTESSGEKEYKINKRNAFIKTIIPVLLFVLTIGFSFYFLYNRIIGAGAINTIAAYIQLTILLAGIAVSTLLLWYEMDRNNPLLHKVCTGIAKGNCNAILTGKAAKLFSWLSWSEVGFFFFSGAFLILLFAGNVANATVIVAWLHILALPYIIFSVYYQWQVAKQWCVLCLVVQALLLFGGVNAILGNTINSVTNFLAGEALAIVGIFLLPVLIWYAVKPYILKLQTAKDTRKQYLRLKFNTEIFETLLSKQKQITTPVDGLGIVIGSPNAQHEIVKVCNPYCGPCSKAHPEIEKLLEENKSIKARIIFTATNNENDERNKPVKHLLAIAATNDERKITQALDDWYLTTKKDYEFFANKYPLNGELKQQDEKVNAMDMWCNNNSIVATPTIFINGKQLPDAYSIGDLQYFLTE